MKREHVLTILIFTCLALLLWTGLTLKQHGKLKSAHSKLIASCNQSIVPTHFEIARTTQNCTLKTPKLLCWIMTVDSREGRQKSRAGLETWGRRCDKVLLVRNGTRLRERNGVVTIPLEHEGRDQLWHKVVAAFYHLYKHHLNEYDWFMKADDDTYVIVERLRQFLSKHSHEEPVYFGYKFKPYVQQGYMSGGSGYVLSKHALKLLVERAFRGELENCRLRDAQEEDVLIGGCLEAVGVRAGDTRDSLGRPTFLALSPLDLLSEREINPNFWYAQYAFYGPPKPGKDCCSKEPISFHYIDPRLMYLIDWLLYDVKSLNLSKQIDNMPCSEQSHKYRNLIM